MKSESLQVRQTTYISSSKPGSNKLIYKDEFYNKINNWST